MNMFNQNLDYNYKNMNDLNSDEEDDDEDNKEEENKKSKKKSNKRYKANKEFDSKDLMNEQIYSFSKNSQNKMKNFFKRNKKK